MSYRKILVVINEHTGSTVAARYAMALAMSGGGELVLYSSHAEGDDLTAARQAERHLDHLFEQALAHEISVSRISEAGILDRLLSQKAETEGADLVFYPLTPGDLCGVSLQQSTVRHLLQAISADLVVMRIMHMGKPHPRHILVPVAGVISDYGPRVRFLAALAKSFHSQVTLFHRPEVGMVKQPEDLVKLRNELRRHHLRVLERSGSGRIAKAIALEAVSHHNDLIVLGASERGSLRRLFFGNPAGDVMQKPPCNAILFRAARQVP